VSEIRRPLPLRWRVFLATSITVTALFGVVGWGMQRYLIAETESRVRTELRASIQAYQSVWKARTQVLAVATALMSAMSDVRSAFMTHDPKTIRDSAQELWSRVSDGSAVFLVLAPDGHLIASLGRNSSALPVSAIPLQEAELKFPSQLSGYLSVNGSLYYIVLTPVYVEGTSEPLLLNVLCAGFAIDAGVSAELKHLAPQTGFAFTDGSRVFASTLPEFRLSANPDGFLVSHQPLRDVVGRPVAELQVLYPYAPISTSLHGLNGVLALAWGVTVLAALLISSYTTRRLLQPVKLLDRAALEVSVGNYGFRVPESGSDELARLGATFNRMCESIEQARAELIRHEQIQTIGRLGTSLVHDLRNPLAAIYGGAEMLVDGQLPPEHVKRVADNIYRASLRLQELLRDLLNISRGQKSKPELCRMKEVIEAAADSVAFPKDRIHLNLQVDDDCEAMADRSRAERVFSNLFSNALEAMPDGGRIQVWTEPAPESLQVLVQDSGPGIPDPIRTHMFRPFVTSKRSGLGLGLTLSRQTMLDMGGNLTVLDRPGGACFCVTFAVSGTADPSPAAALKTIHT
jgi:signal transduction histidine kinase